MGIIIHPDQLANAEMIATPDLSVSERWELLKRKLFGKFKMAQGPFHSDKMFPSWEVRASIQKTRPTRVTALDSDNFDGPRNILINWLEGKYGESVSEQLAGDRSFGHSANGDHILQVEVKENAWAFRAFYPDDQGRHHLTDASLIRKPAKKGHGTSRVELHVTQNAILAEGEDSAPADFPSFLPLLAAEYSLIDAGERLSTHAQLIDSKASYEKLKIFINRDTRHHPIAVFVSPEPPVQSRRSLRAPPTSAEAENETFVRHVVPIFRYLTGSLGGLAHIVVIPPKEDVLQALAADDGASRLAPGTIHIFAPGNSAGRYFTINTAIRNRANGWAGFRAYLQNLLPRLTYHSPGSTSPFHNVRTINAPSEKAVDLDDILEGLLKIEADVRLFEASHAQGANLGVEGAEKLSTCIMELKRYQEIHKDPTFDQFYSEMTSRADKVRHAFTALAYGITKPYEEKYEAIAEWVKQHYGDHVTLAPSLVSALRNPKREGYYRDVNLVYAAVELLATHFYAHKTSQGAAARFHHTMFTSRLNELRLDDTRSLVGKASKAITDGHTVTVDNDRIFLENHIGRGISLNPQDTLRIYYVWDAKRERIVIGHMTSHLKNMLTSRIT